MSNITECKSPCYNQEYMVNGVGVAVFTECKGSSPISVFVETGSYTFCHDGSGVVFKGSLFAFPVGEKVVCGCND